MDNLHVSTHFIIIIKYDLLSNIFFKILNLSYLKDNMIKLFLFVLLFNPYTNRKLNK